MPQTTNDLFSKLEFKFKMKLYFWYSCVWRCYEMKSENETFIFPSRSHLWIYVSPELWALPLTLRTGNGRSKARSSSWIMKKSGQDCTLRAQKSHHVTPLGAWVLRYRISTLNILGFLSLLKNLNLPFFPLQVILLKPWLLPRPLLSVAVIWFINSVTELFLVYL